jgi:peroxiredoxin family protein
MTALLQDNPTPAPAAPATGIRRLAIVVRDDAFDRLLTPLTFAWEFGRRGVEVDVLFVLWASRVLTREGVQQTQMDPSVADRKAWLIERLQHEGAPTDLHGFIKAAHATGHVRFHACRLAAITFGVEEHDLLPEAEGIIDPAVFMETAAVRADHCQYF